MILLKLIMKVILFDLDLNPLNKPQDYELLPMLLYVSFQLHNQSDLEIEICLDFQEKLKEFKLNPAKKDVPLMDYLKFLSHISSVYRQTLPQFLSNEMLNLLQQYYAILHPEVRMTLVTCLKIMRGKDNVQAVVVLPVFFKLFRCQDKELRKFLHGSLITDLKEINKNAKNHAVNKKLQGFVLSLL